MKNLLALLTLFISTFSLAMPSHLRLSAGEQLSIPKDFPGTLRVTNPKTLIIKIVRNRLQLIGKKPGLSRLLTPSGQTEVVVFHSKLLPLIKDLEPLSETSSQLEVQPQKIILKGEVNRPGFWRYAHKLALKYPNLIDLKLKFSHAGQELFLKEFNRDFLKKSLTAHIDMLDGAPVMQISQDATKAEKHVAEEAARLWGIDTTEPTQTLDIKPMIEVSITIAELKISEATKLGIQFPSSYTATIVPSGDLSSASTTFSQAEFQLHTLLSEGRAKILANPKLVCRSGEAAHFVAGGEIPIKVSSWKHSGVIWKRYGVILDVEPTADKSGNIASKLVTEVSLMDESHKIDGIPGLFTNRVETHFNLRGQKTIALSGLIKSEMGRNSESLPLLSSIPVLGELFKSRDYQSHRTELIVFVTPRVIDQSTDEDPKLPFHWDDE